MRVREKGFLDYGISPEEEQKLLGYCRKASTSAGADVSNKLFSITQEVNACISSELYISLVWGLSYDKISMFRDVQYSKVDFYGYRRMCLAELKKKMEE